MKILVSGGAGFLGSNLAEKLASSGHDLILVDNLITGSEVNIKEIRNLSNVRFYKSNIIDFIDNFNEKLDQIYHLASPASPPKYMQFAYETMMANTIGTDKLCQYAIKTKARILFSSTSEIYGDPLVHPQNEKYFGNVNTLGVRSVYDEAKRFGETIISHHKRTQNLDCVIVRIFNTYGPKMDPYDGRVVSNFIRQNLQGSALTIYGEGLQTRSFCFVDDLIAGLVLAMNGQESGPINLGNPEEFTLLELAKIISKILETELQLKFEKILEDDPKKRKPDISLARDLLNWNPATPLEDGLIPTIEWIKSRL